MSDDFNGEREYTSLREAEAARRQREKEEKNQKSGVFGDLKTYSDYAAQQAHLLSILHADENPTEASRLLCYIAMNALGEQYRQHKMKGRKTDSRKLATIQLYLLQAVREQVNRSGSVTRPRNLVGRTIALAERDGITLAERTVRNAVKDWAGMIERKAIREIGE